MIKKKSNTQNIIIIVLCILLLISIAFGFTYSYYNGRTNLVKGTITTANLAIEIHGQDPADNSWAKAEFFLSEDIGEKHYIPGNSLENVALNIFNKCRMETYMVIVYSLSAVKNDPGNTVVDVSKTPAVEFDLTKVNSAWKPLNYTTADATYTCLVGVNPFEGCPTTMEGKPISILQANALKIPGADWGNDLQGCTVTISVKAYAIQAELDGPYAEKIFQANADIEDAQNSGNSALLTNAVQAKAETVAEIVLEICGVTA